MDRLAHYELAKGADGNPVELGRGAMGVTWKAFDVDLRCPVALKVINEHFISDESARLRFLREARAAASVRHPNVASVFYLGRAGENYFYAMEFVEGETLAGLMKRSGRLELKLALEIVTQVATGLAAVHKQKLVHRDIKPSNIMVSFEETGTVTAKIIDLGLAKQVDGQGSGTTISRPGGFAGTPRYASPEQFAGVEVDIRSDLYSLGVILWEMVTGQALFSGSPAEMMYQHQHAPLPLELLIGLPSPTVFVIKTLLEKDPRRRFQTPAELLVAISAGTDFEDGGTVAFQTPPQAPAGRSCSTTRRPPFGPEKISVARLPVTGSDIFGRKEDLAFLDDCWANQQINVVTIAAWAGVGKSTLVNHWLRGMAAQQYRSAEFVFGWSFYRQGSSGDISSGDEFVHAALAWFGDPDPRIGTPWEKGERLANLIACRRTLLILDGFEPLQYPPGPQEGRIRDPSLQALLRQLAAFNGGLCVVTTRMPVADIADQERTSAPRRDLEHLSSEEGAQLLQALGVHGDEAELRGASDEFSGHCLALTLLGSYLTDAHHGDIRRRGEVSGRLAHDARQGAHARRVMESYQSWFGEGPEVSVLRLLGLFDRPADDRTVDALLKPPAIPGLTESLVELSASERRKVLARLRRARLLAGVDPQHPGHLDAHPIVREHFGEQLQTQQKEAWKQANRRLYDHYRNLAPPLPNTFGEMEPLFLAIVCGCRAGLLREALHEVYMARVQRGNRSFAANVLGARGALLSALVHFFEERSWESPLRTGIGDQQLAPEDQLFILMQAALHLSVTRGMQLPDVQICHERALPLCEALGRADLLFVALIGQWRHSLVTGRLATTLRIAERISSLAQEQKGSAPRLKACMALAATRYYLGNFEEARQAATSGIEILHSGGVQAQVEELDEPAIACLCHEALCAWHFGESSCHAPIDEAIALAKKIGDTHGLAVALYFGMILGHFERNPAEVESRGSDLVELSTRQGFVHFLPLATILLGWARGMSGQTSQAISWIEEGMEKLRTSGGVLCWPYLLALKAEPLHLAGRTAEALEVINEAEAIAEQSGELWWCADLQRLRSVFLAALGAEDARVASSFRDAIRTARDQQSISLERRAEQAYADYRAKKGETVAG